jgi:hypothetical protein
LDVTFIVLVVRWIEPSMSLDHETRIAAFDWLKGQAAVHGDVLPRRVLEKGFVRAGRRVPLMSPAGIFRPKGLDYPLTITTAPEGPYDDRISTEGLLSYRYRGNDPRHRDNIIVDEKCPQNVEIKIPPEASDREYPWRDKMNSGGGMRRCSRRRTGWISRHSMREGFIRRI